MMPEEYRHCETYIDDEGQPKCLRNFIRFHRWPGYYQARAFKWKIKVPKCFATYDGVRVQLTMASRFGDVGISKNLVNPIGYDAGRVPLQFLTDFSETA